MEAIEPEAEPPVKKSGGLGITPELLHEVFLNPGIFLLFAAVPAVQRLAIPEASPTLPLAASLGLTFSYNVTIGIPLYLMIAKVLITAWPVAAAAAAAGAA